MRKKKMPLSEVLPGQTARVTEIRLEGVLRRRLFDLGLIPGTLVLCRCVAPAGSPMAFTVRGAAIALRRCDASQISAEADA